MPVPCAGEMRGATTLDDWLAAEGPKLVAQEAGDPVHHARLSRRQAGAAPDEPAGLPRPHAAGLAGDAGRLCPHRPHPRRDRHRHAARRLGRRCLDRQRTRRSSRTTTLLPGARPASSAPQPGALPTRAADNLFWLGRYVERTEGLMRLLRAWNVRLAESGDRGAAAAVIATELLRLRRRSRTAAPARPDRHPRQRDLQRQPRPRPLLARRLGGAGRPGQDRSAAWPTRVSAGRRRGTRHGRPAAQDHGLLRPRAREHVSLHRLALPDHRPLARTCRDDGRSARHAGRAEAPTARSISRSRSATAS